MAMKTVTYDGLLYFWQKLKSILNNKVDKVTGKSLIDDIEIKRLSNVYNYDDTQLISDISSTYETKVNVSNHTKNNNVHVTELEKNKWNLTQENVIESIKVNGVTQSVVDKSITLNIPTKVTELADNQNYVKTTDIIDFAKISDVEAKISSAVATAYKYKGSVANYTDLPTTDLSIGFVYNVENASPNNKAGENLAWNGTDWDRLGGLVDLTDYLLASDLIAVTNSEIDEIVTS